MAGGYYVSSAAELRPGLFQHRGLLQQRQGRQSQHSGCDKHSGLTDAAAGLRNHLPAVTGDAAGTAGGAYLEGGDEMAYIAHVSACWQIASYAGVGDQIQHGAHGERHQGDDAEGGEFGGGHGNTSRQNNGFFIIRYQRL